MICLLFAEYFVCAEVCDATGDAICKGAGYINSL